MSLLDRLPLPRRLSSRIWLITLPSAVVSFERRSGLPRLPGALRWLGAPLLIGGALLGAWALRNPDTVVEYRGPLREVGRRPATSAGLLLLAGLALLLRSLMLLLYSLGLALAAGTGRVAVEEPSPAAVLGRDGED